MTKVKNFIFILSMFLLLITSLAPIKAQGYNETVKALNQSRIDLQETVDAGYSVLRINDTLSQAQQLFEAQYALEKAGGVPDYSLILERTKEVAELREQTEEMSDELKALEARIKEIRYESEAIAIFNKAKEEFADERYDKVAELVEESYVKISEEQALQTRFRAIYEASTKTVADFFKDRWKEITFTIVIISTVYLFSHKRIAIYLINKKINSLNFEKEILKKLIKQTQYEYFHLFKIPEELYHIRIGKFGELIRDIERQIPLQVEERARIKGLAKEDAKPENLKSHKKIVITVISILTFITAVIFLIIYFKIDSYSEILEFIKKMGLNVTETLNLIIDTFGVIALVVSSILILSAIFLYIYIRKKRKKEEPQIEKEKRFEFLQPLQIFISNKIIKLKLYADHLIKRIESAIEYRRLLRQKREQEELPRIRYLRKQKLKSFKNNLKQKIHSLFHSISLVKTEEEKLPEKDGEARLRGEKRRKEFRKQRQKEIKKKKAIELLQPPPPS